MHTLQVISLRWKDTKLGRRLGFILSHAMDLKLFDSLLREGRRGLGEDDMTEVN